MMDCYSSKKWLVIISDQLLKQCSFHNIHCSYYFVSTIYVLIKILFPIYFCPIYLLSFDSKLQFIITHCIPILKWRIAWINCLKYSCLLRNMKSFISNNQSNHSRITMYKQCGDALVLINSRAAWPKQLLIFSLWIWWLPTLPLTQSLILWKISAINVRLRLIKIPLLSK